MEADLTGLLSLIEHLPDYRRLVAGLRQGGGSTGVSLPVAARPYLVASLYHHLRLPVLLVTPQPDNAASLYEQLLTWCASPLLRLFPEPDALPYQSVAADKSAELDRLQVLSTLAGAAGNDGAAALPPLVVTSAAALMQKTASYQRFVTARHRLEVGMEIEPFQLLSRWQEMGYRLENLVEVPGTISHRGGIIDIYPPGNGLPYRLEFFGNVIDSIRLFDPADQRSMRTVSSIELTPAAEIISSIVEDSLEPETGSLLDYLPPDTLIILDDPEGIKLAMADLEVKAEELRAEKLARDELSPVVPRPYFSWPELEPSVEKKQCLALFSWGVAGAEEGYQLDFSSAPVYAGQMPEFLGKAGEMLAEEKRLIVVSHHAARLAELLAEEGIPVTPVSEVRQLPPPGSLTLLPGLLAGGWVMNGDTFLFTDAEIFGFIKQRRSLKKRPAPHYRLFVDINPGDHVVHVEHGIARFAGVITMPGVDGGEKEFLVLEYAAGDKLYVPTDQIDRVSHYVGAGERTPVLSRLGTQEWTRTRQRVKESVAAGARDLLALYAAREVVPGHAFVADTIWQQEMEASFPYVETPDQLTVQKQVKEDMEQAKPMDRLVCGDVGYGKTEVALRAAFKAVMDGKQVAVLVPTTILAEQHFATFSERLASFPVRVEVLSRFRAASEQEKVLEGLAEGAVDICIGTHRLLQKDVVFKNLGLLIIDEEQRFGVAHKEHFKKLRREVDVLTLSATPIPRTLHMSLVGVRDMSVMETPPEERRPVKTYVAAYDERLVREAILRELERNGQVFFVHNRVQSIALVAEKLRKLVPEARIAIAHGQMAESALEEVMADFIRGRSDILVCSTIIESGLDMPNVNTLIVNQADRFGLSQLYQLRGRVGRGAHLAYAYFLHEPGKRLTPTAEKRLRTIFEATELGAGFGIAMRDLEIRGAGSLLGMRQSGHISAVGFNLYCQMLAKAVEEEKAKQAGVTESAITSSSLPSPSIDLPLPSFIPGDYVSDLVTRLGLYQKLAKMEKPEQLEEMGREMADRFGGLPVEVSNLLYAVRLKIMAAQTGIESITTEHGEIVISLFEGMRFDMKKLGHLAGEGIKINPVSIRLSPKRLGKGWRKTLEKVVKNIT